ncbi:hypothetical protein C7B64_13365 [Merismopedia glauca CCAP 1448/3]|uniref:Actin-like protein N-terminal domain-containing protein n=2 Tax=Merismopedia TaxID=53402 RepID=A0A2T1C275_9CYAN|nr:hypothetical protein C7B64_13365 [Merismopedia glauca CCAP 1448/3]
MDTGGSLLKATGSKGKSPPTCIAIEPEVIPVVRKPTLHLLERSLDPTRWAWVSVNGDQYAVGALAREEYRATIPLVKPKIDYFIPRTLATVAAYAYHFNTRSFDLYLSCLLPPAEYKSLNMRDLEEKLRGALSSYSTLFADIKANLKQLKVFPEGLGLLKHYHQYRGDLPERVLVVLFGHRNISLFEMNSGVCRHFNSCDRGFASILPKLSDTLNLSSRECLAQSSQWATDERSRDVIQEYWHSIESWLTEHIPPETDEVVIGGGAVVWLRQEIIYFFHSRLPLLDGRDYPGIFFDGGFKDKDWSPSIQLDPQLRVRFADSYLNWRYNYGS